MIIQFGELIGQSVALHQADFSQKQFTMWTENLVLDFLLRRELRFELFDLGCVQNGRRCGAL